MKFILRSFRSQTVWDHSKERSENWFGVKGVLGLHRETETTNVLKRAGLTQLYFKTVLLSILSQTTSDKNVSNPPIKGNAWNKLKWKGRDEEMEREHDVWECVA